MTPPLRLRPVVEGDEARMREVFAASREPELAALPSGVVEVFVESQYRLQQQHYRAHRPEATWSVIEVDGSAAGRVVIDRSCRPYLVVDLVVVPEMRCRGVATTILAALIDEAQQAGTGVRLTVRADNHPAIRLYERLGLRTDGVDCGYMSMSTRGEEG